MSIPKNETFFLFKYTNPAMAADMTIILKTIANPIGTNNSFDEYGFSSKFLLQDWHGGQHESHMQQM